MYMYMYMYHHCVDFFCTRFGPSDLTELCAIVDWRVATHACLTYSDGVN